MKERLFVWGGGALFVGSLATCAYCYLMVWGRPQSPAAVSIAINALLLALFAAHHSLLARETVKARLARIVPQRLLRSIYVWTASALLIVVCIFWQPIGGVVYRDTGWRALPHAIVQIAGLWMIAESARAIDPLELAGIRIQAARDALQITGPYRWVRHPLYLGWILAAFGAAHMTGDRLAFAAITSLYLAIAVPWEERSLKESFGRDYLDYMQRVRWRIIPYVY